MKILLAGGAGYIGSHTAVELLDAGLEVVIVDNYCNSSPVAVKRVEEITGKKVESFEADIKVEISPTASPSTALATSVGKSCIRNFEVLICSCSMVWKALAAGWHLSMTACAVTGSLNVTMV